MGILEAAAPLSAISSQLSAGANAARTGETPVLREQLVPAFGGQECPPYIGIADSYLPCDRNHRRFGHELTCWLCRSGFVKPKFIAAILLLNLVAWTNSAAFCLSGLSAMASHVAAAAGISPQHPCCPHPTAKPAARDRTQSPSSGNGHRCCFVQNPQIPSNLPGRAQNSNQRGPVAILPQLPGMATTSHAAIATSAIDGLRTNSRCSTVLRI